MKTAAKATEKPGKFGVWLQTFMKKKGINGIGALSGSLGLASHIITRAIPENKAPTVLIARLKSKYRIDVPAYLVPDEKVEEEDTESHSDAQGRSPPVKRVLWLFNEFINVYHKELTDILTPKPITQSRDSLWGKELRKRRSRLINSDVFHLPTIKAIYLMNLQTVRKNFPKQTIKNLIEGVPMTDQVYLKFCRISNVRVQDILNPALRPLIAKINQLPYE
jgi:hypothetical protein